MLSLLALGRVCGRRGIGGRGIGGALLILIHGRIFHIKMPEPFFGLLIFFGERSVFVKKAGEGIAVDPYFIVALLLGLVKNEL